MQLLLLLKSREFSRGSRCCFDDAAAGAGSLERALSFCACHNRAPSMLQNLWLEHDFACLETDHYAGLCEVNFRGLSRIIFAPLSGASFLYTLSPFAVLSSPVSLSK
jgi:hypothetical protein